MALSSALAFFIERALDAAGPAPSDLDTRSLAHLWAFHMSVQTVLLGLLGIGVALGLGAAKLGRREWIAPIVVGLLAGAVAIWPMKDVGEIAVQGPWISQQSWADLARDLPAVAGPLGVALASALALWPIKKWWWLRVVAAMALLGASGAFMLVDARVMVGRFRPFHVLAYTTGSYLAVLAMVRLVPPLKIERWRLLLALVPALAMATTAGVMMTTLDARTRVRLMQGSAVADHALRTLLPKRKKQRPLRDTLIAIDPNEGELAGTSTIERGLLGATAPNGKPWSVVLIVVDTWRYEAAPPYDHTGVDFMEAGDMPFLDAWAGDAFRFSRAYAQASATHRSMPAMFRSIHPFEVNDPPGVALGTHMSQHGLATGAVINNFFLEPRMKQTRGLLEGFESVLPYEDTAQDDIVPGVESFLDNVGDHNFFAWVHFYNLHRPGFAHGGRMTEKAMPHPQRYRRSLQWLDERLSDVIGRIEGSAQGENTIIVLCADHGEGIGANRQVGHSITAYEEEVRTPLMIKIPGQPGRQIDHVVGNVDLLPTITDVLGQEAAPHYRGRTLLPLLLDEKTSWRHPYYVENGKHDPTENVMAVVDGPNKLIFERDGEVFTHYDVVADPTEDVDLYDPQNRRDVELRRELLRFNPEPFAKELEKKATRRVLRARLREIDPKRPGADVDFLLQVAALTENEKYAEQFVEIGHRLFDEAGSDVLRGRVLKHMLAKDRSAFGTQVEARLEEVAHQDAELEFVSALADVRQGPIAIETVAEHFQWWVDNRPDDVDPWLRLLRNWSTLQAKKFAAPVHAVVLDARAQGAGGEHRLRAALGLATKLRPSKHSANRALAETLSTMVDEPDPQLAAAIIRALGRVGDDSALPGLRPALDSPAPMVRQAAFDAIARAGGKSTLPELLARARDDDYLVVNAIRLVGRWRSTTPEALEYMRDVRKNHHSWWVRSRAKKQVKRIQKAQKKAKARDESGTGGSE